MAHPHFHALLLVKPQYFQGKYYIKQADWVEMWAKAFASRLFAIGQREGS